MIGDVAVVVKALGLIIRIGMLSLCLILQFEVGSLTVVEPLVFVVADGTVQVVVVGAVVGDVQFAVAVNQRQVTVAIEATHAVAANGHQVFVEHVGHRCRGIAEHRVCVSIDRIGTGRHVTAGKDGIADGDAQVIKVAASVCLPVAVAGREGVQVFCGHQVANSIGIPVYGCRIGHHHVGRDDDFTVFGQFAAIVIITVGCLCSGAIDIAQVTATEHVAVSLCHSGFRTYAATVDVHLGGAVDVACRAERTHTLQVVVTTAAAEDITHDKATVHADVGSAALGDGHPLRALAATTDTANLTTAIDAVAHHAVIHGHVGAVHVAVVHIAAAEDVSGLDEPVLADDAVIRHIVGSRLVMKLLLVMLVNVGGLWVIGA